MNNRVYQPCEICGRLVATCGLKRHLRSHELGTADKPAFKHATLDHDDLFCKYCGVEKKNRNSLIQHEIRCPQNPNRTAYTSLVGCNSIPKGSTKETCETIRKQVETRKRKQLEPGYVSPWKGTQHKVIHKYDEHNAKEIQKWIDYVSSIELRIPNYKVYFNEKYRVVSNHDLTVECNQKKGTHTILHEHVYFMMLVFGNNFEPCNVVHHVDKNPQNNDLSNLILFNSNSDHVRFHKSDYAWLIYHEDTHKFTCIVKH